MANRIVSQNIIPCNGKSERAASLWSLWWEAMLLLQPAFVHVRSFLWFAAVVAGLTVRTDLHGVTSIVRSLKLFPRCYDTLLKHFHGNAVRLDALAALWARTVPRLFPQPLRVNGRLVLVGDGIKVTKYGKKMPGVKLLHQQAEHKAEWIMGHSLQAVSLLVHAAGAFVAVPLAVRIHEGIVWSNRHKKTLLHKMLTLLSIADTGAPFYLVADAYYAAGTMIAGLREQGHHLVTRLKANAVAYLPYEHQGPRKRGRPRLYGEKIALTTLFDHASHIVEVASPVYGEKDITLRYAVRDLLWRPAGTLVRLVAVEHPQRGKCVLLCTDTTLDPIEIIRLYGLRFKIEHAFKQAVHVIGAFAYRFWMKAMTPLQRGDGDQYLHRKTQEYRDTVRRKLQAYHAFLQAGVIAQGMALYLAATTPNLVWGSFGSWLRTIRPGIAPSEFVVAEALRRTLPQFLLASADCHVFAKFITQRQDLQSAEMWSIAA